MQRLSPTVILNDVTYTVMSELLQFMYQGVVNVKHTDLSAFMKIAQALQIKGLTTSTSSSSAAMHQRPSVPVSPKMAHNMVALLPGASSSKSGGGGDATSAADAASTSFHHPNMAANNVIDTKINSAPFGGAGSGSNNMMNAMKSAGHLLSASVGVGPSDLSSSGQKRSMMEYGGSGSNEYNKRSALSRGSDGYMGHGGGASDHEMHGADSMENLSSDEGFMPPIPQISMLAGDGSGAAGRFDLNNVKRESLESGLLSPNAVMRGLVPPPYFDYNATGLYGGGNGSGSGAGGSGLMVGGVGGNGVGGARAGSSASSVKNVEYPNELHMGGGEYGSGKGGGVNAVSVNHMDIPAGMCYISNYLFYYMCSVCCSFIILCCIACGCGLLLFYGL